MTKKPKKYSLLYLPTGRCIEIFAPMTTNRMSSCSYRIAIKSRQDLLLILKAILEGEYHPEFYKYNEILKPDKLQSCFFSFQRVS